MAVCYPGSIGGGDSAAGPLTWRGASRLSAQLRAISLEYSHAELAAATSDFHVSKRLGSGCYGSVYRGELKDGSDVAIKAIDLSVLMGKGECPEDAGFEDEVTLLSKFRHPHLVTLLGWGQHCLQRFLVYEFLSGGDVFQRLHKCHCGQQGFPWHDRLSVLLDAASGLSHMHNATPKAFHRDIKSANILLDRHGTAKMADFGLSCVSQNGATNITVKTIGGTPGYKCPVYERTRRCTESSEVYSFGMVMLEVMTGLDPSATDPAAPRGIVFPLAKTVAPNTPGALQRLRRSADTTASWPRDLFEELTPLALRSVCCPEEEKRPTFVELVRQLKSTVERFPPRSSSERVDMLQAEASIKHSDGSGGSSPRHSPRPPQVAGQQPCQPSSGFRLHASPRLPSVAAGRCDVSLQSPDRAKLSAAVQQSSYSGPLQSRVVEKDPSDAEFLLELLESAGCDAEELPVEERRLELKPDPEGGQGGRLATRVGRHWQSRLFEAWLPNSQQRACISRSALQISWSRSGGDATILAEGSNPLLVDAIPLQRGSSISLKSGAEITFRYEMHVLLRLRFAAVGNSLLMPPPPRFPSQSEAVRARSDGAMVPPGAGVPAQAVDRPRGRLGDAEQALTSESTVFQLTCKTAKGLSEEYFAALPSSLRNVNLHVGRNLIGRHYQQLFEALLCPLERLNVSPCHLWLDVMLEQDFVQVTNLSSTLEIFVGEEHVPKDRTAHLHEGQVLTFAKRDGPGFLQLLLFQATRPTNVAELPVSIAVAGKAQQPRRGVQRHGGSPCSPQPAESSLQCRVPPLPVGQARKSVPNGPMSTEDSEVFSPSVVLVLTGEGTKDLPAEKRRLGPMTLRQGPWIMGRRHQREFLQAVVKEEYIDFVSRNHFAIAFEDQCFFLLALSQNRIWLDRGEASGTRSLQRDEMQRLQPGNRILLGTSEAGDSAGIDSPRLCWHFDVAERPF